MGDIQEFQAIILAGVGSRLSVLTEDLDKVPKALLPVANKPMLHYQLQWLESAKITNIIVLAQNSARQKINEFLYKTYELSSRQTKIELICLDEAEGSADSLRHIKDKIKFDFIVLSSDLIIDIPAHTVLDTFRALRSTVTVLFSESSKAERSEGRGNKDEDTSDYVGINHKKARLLYMAPKVDVDDDTFLSLHMALIKKFPVINFHTHLRDAHLYIFNRWVMDLIYSKKHISSLKADLLPLLIECQYNKNLYEREGIDQFQPQSQSMTTAYLCSTTGTPDGMTIPPFMRTNTVSEHSSPNQLYRGMIGDAEEVSRWKEEISCGGIVIDESAGFCTNTLGSYLDINLKMAKLNGKNSKQSRPNSASVAEKSQIGVDSMIGDDTKIGERCSVKRSVIGAHCSIGKNVKISDSVIHDYVTIEDNVKLDGCILSSSSRICEKSQLKDCEVAFGYIVKKETNTKGDDFSNL